MPPSLPQPALEFAFEAHIELGAPMELGSVPYGHRRIIPIVGGTFEGPRVKGRVLNHGADWQIVRTDGFAVIDTRYAIETDQGSLIYVVNLGMRHGPAEVMARLRAGQDVPPAEYYFRTAPVFETADPELKWLMQATFIATAARKANQVIVEFGRVL